MTGQLTSRDRLLTTLFDHLPAMIAYWDRDARNVVGNAAYVEWFGFSPDEMLGRHISEILGPEVYAKNLPFIEGALAGEEQLFDRTLVDSSGQVRHTQASYVPDVVDGEVQGFFVLVTDVTPRVAAQRAMDEAQGLAHLGSWSMSVASGEITWTDELSRIVGIDPDHSDMSFDSLSHLVHPDDRERVRAQIASASSEGVSYSISYRIERPDGDVREVLSRGRSVPNPDGVITHISGTMQDVTESNRAARELARINRELRDANQVNADVIAMLGHDIGSPLAAIAGFSEMLDQQWTMFDEDQRRAMARRIAGAAGRMRGLVESILALASVDAGSIRPTTESIDLTTALPVLLADLPQGDRVELRMTPGLPAVDVDRVHLAQIVTNLVANAFRYGAEPVRLVVSGEDGAVDVAVEDAGDGVPDAAVPALFDRFARTGQVQKTKGGSGFGLYISQCLAQANGGLVDYEAAEHGRSHRFVLRLPQTPLS